MSIQNKIPTLIVDLTKKLVQQMVPSITQIVGKIGIQNIGQSDMTMPGICLLSNELQDILVLRNKLMDRLNSTSNKINILSKSLDPLDSALNTTKKGLNTAQIAFKVAETAITLTPPAVPIPGSLIVGYTKINDLLNNFLPSTITAFSNKISSISSALDYADSTIFKLLNLLKIIDQYLTGCGVSTSELTSTNDYVNKVNQQYTEVQLIPSNIEVYKGFTLEIVEEPFSPTVNRRKGVAKNSQGIILLSTPLSFTTLPQILIEELKLIIDSNDLKAN